MGRPPCCDESGVKKGPWTPEEDEKLMDYINKHGYGNWRTLPKNAGLNRCGKSCRLRWANYLRPDIKRGKFTEEEERIIINLHSVIGNKWSKIATHLPGRTDNEIKNFWNTHIRKKLLQMGIDPETHKPRTDFSHLMNLSNLLGISSNLGNSMNPWSNPLTLQADIAKIQLLQNLLQIMNSNSFVNNMGGNANYLFGNIQSLNPIDAFPNGSSNTLQINEPTLKGQEYVNPSLFSQGQSDLEGGSNEQVVNGHNKSKSTSYENQEENLLLPSLVASSPNTAQIFTQSPPNTIFEAWEKFLVDDETSDSYWKEILDSTSTSASPISW